MNKKAIISEITRMKSLFGYQKGVVISEQITENQRLALQLGYGPVSAQRAEELAKQGKLNPVAGTQQQPQNVLSLMGQNYSQSMAQGVENKANTVTNQNVAAAASSSERQTNINNTYGKVDSQGIIKNPGNAWDGSPWNSYVSTYKVTADEIEKAMAATKPKTQQQQPQFVAEKFPLKYMMQGENVKKLQQALGLKTKSGQPNITGKFYNATQTALDLKARELGITYDRNVGLDEASFNEIIQAAQPKRELEKVEPVLARTETPNLTNLTPTLPANIQAPQIQPIQVQLTLDQQFQVAKDNLDKAKAELDAAQKTDDRVAIGTARGKQQAARQEVQRLRNELYLQSQQQQ